MRMPTQQQSQQLQMAEEAAAHLLLEVGGVDVAALVGGVERLGGASVWLHAAEHLGVVLDDGRGYRARPPSCRPRRGMGRQLCSAQSASAGAQGHRLGVLEDHVPGDLIGQHALARRRSASGFFWVTS